MNRKRGINNKEVKGSVTKPTQSEGENWYRDKITPEAENEQREGKKIKKKPEKEIKLQGNNLINCDCICAILEPEAKKCYATRWWIKK